MIRKVLVVLIAFIIGNNVAFSQNGSSNQVKQDSVKIRVIESKSPISSVSLDQYNSYRSGKAVDMALVAELNNYPNPARALELEKNLKLSIAQKTQLKAVVDALQQKALEMGVFILQQEKKLSDLFVSTKVNEGSIIYYTNKIGLYQGELRNAHLQAHFKVRKILTADQIRKYNQLQGYSK